MRPKFNLISKVIACLEKNKERKLTAREIAEWIFENYKSDCRHKQRHAKARKNDASLIQQIIAEICACRHRIQKKYPHIKTTEKPPHKYYYTEKKDNAEIDPAESIDSPSADSDSDTSLKESALYKPLATFLSSKHEIYSRRIDEKKVIGRRPVRQGNKWLYPDLVGVKDLSKDWNQEIKEIVKQYADKKTQLWSFEVKKSIGRSNIREAFFQTVSNSSWAHFGYLVAPDIADDARKELRMLSGLHGIGFIRLNMDNPLDSQILVSARERSGIDWDAANRLATANKDFLDYIQVVRQFYQTNKLRPTDDWYKRPQAD